MTVPDIGNELGADNVLVTPDHFVGAVLETSFTRKAQHKFVGNPETVGGDPHAFLRKIVDDAVAR